MKKTKIICTMGPNTDDEEMMRKLVKAGMDVARFNFSHGDHEEQKIRMDLLKKVRKELKLPIAILLDTKGPEIRTGILEGGQKVYLEEGSRFTLTTEQIEGNNTRCSQTYKNLPKDVKVGDTILIDDGLIQLTVAIRFKPPIRIAATQNARIREETTTATEYCPKNGIPICQITDQKEYR